MMSKSFLQKKALPVCMPLLAGLVTMLLWAQTPSTITFGCAIDAREQIRESRALAKSLASPENPQWRTKGDLHRKYYFAAANADMPYRLYVPTSWDGKSQLPLVMMLHGAGSDENRYVDANDRQLIRLAEQHGYILVSPLGYTRMGAYGTPLRLPAVFGNPEIAAKQRAAVNAEQERILELSEKDVINVLEIVLSEYPVNRSAMFLTGHSMGSGGTWYLGAKYAQYWAGIAPMSGPFVDETNYPWDSIREMPIFMTEGTGATPSLAGSRAMSAWMKERGFKLEYLEVNADHGGMVSLVLPSIFNFFDRYRSKADNAAPAPGFIGEQGGRGDWPAVAQSRADLRTHTLYRPVVLPAEPLPLLIWGNGGCSDNGLSHEKFLRDIASHGYIVIALGYAWQQPPRNDPASQEKDATDVAQMSQAVTWAAERTADPVDELYEHIDTSRIAVAGHSCGGLQAIKFSADPRTSTSMIFDSGVYNQPGGRSKIQVSKDELANLHGPIAYFTGGPTDVAHPNASDDVTRIKHVPVFFGWLPVGHGGTFSAPDGGDWSQVAAHWLDWQLKGNRAAGGWFLGEDCGLCREERWTVERFASP